MGWIDAELALVALAAMFSPTTLSFCVLALVLGDRPRRTGLWFYVGAMSATFAIGVLAAFVLGDVAASPTSSPKTWVAIVDIVAAVLLLVWVARVVRRPISPQKMDGMIAQMSKVASSPAIAIVGAGAALANPGGFIPIALKDISETESERGAVRRRLAVLLARVAAAARRRDRDAVRRAGADEADPRHDPNLAHRATR